MSDASFSPVVLNDALGSNPPDANLHQSTHASDWMWTVFSIMTLADLLWIFWSIRRPRNFLFHQIAIIVLTVSSVAYFSMASNLGHTPITVEFNRSHIGPLTRDIWYVRYIQWFINAPLELLLIFIGTGFPLRDTFVTLFMADALVVLGLVGSLVHSTYKWGYYTMGVFALFYVFGHVFFNTARSEFPSPTGRTRGPFIGTAAILAFLWTIYPIIWALADGGNVINPSAEMTWYGIMDVLTGPCFLAYFIYSHQEVELPGNAVPAARGDVKA
ncbi:family A G protein-coupled receptor-like protein [Dentipellis sp. KUC8613]|nr:family A G protein-coupled receptor-like protein [Dentipellis sp. KUC8613]